MKFFKNPIVAVIISLIIVYSSTLLSFEIKFGDKCDEVANGFQEGVYFNGEYQPSCTSRLRSIAEYAEEINTIAKVYGIESPELSEAIETLNNGLSYSGDDAGYMYYCYSELSSVLSSIKAELHKAQLGDVYEAQLSQYYDAISAEKDAIINTSGYNESVTEFLREYDKFPVSYFYWHTDVIMPSYFT